VTCYNSGGVAKLIDNLMGENRLELLIADVIGVLLIGAVVIGELVYWLRAFR
jgi:hypothetical protein